MSTGTTGRTVLLEGGTGCQTSRTIKAVSAYDPRGRLWRSTLPNWCPLYASVNATPAGGAVVIAQLDGVTTPNGTYKTEIRYYDQFGRLQWCAQLPNIEGDAILGTEYADALQGVDTHGNVIVRRYYQHGLTAPINAYR